MYRARHMRASWGTLAGRLWVDYIFLKDGKVIDLSNVKFPSRRKDEEAVIEGVKMTLINDDSSRNKTRIAYIEDEDKVRAIVRVRFMNEVVGAKDMKILMAPVPYDAEVVYGDGVDVRVFYDWKGVIVYMDGQEIVLIGKRPKVSVVTEAGKLVVSGDTYPIKDDLKLMGFKWDPEKKAWVGEADPDELKEKLVGELGVELS